VIIFQPKRQLNSNVYDYCSQIERDVFCFSKRLIVLKINATNLTCITYKYKFTYLYLVYNLLLKTLQAPYTQLTNCHYFSKVKMFGFLHRTSRVSYLITRLVNVLMLKINR